MGTWGTGINSNDTASDVVDSCKEIYPIVSPEEANRMIFEEYKEILSYDEDDGEVADFWYALANWQWDHGVLPEENKTIVLNMLEKQCGIERWIEEGKRTDISKRKTVLDKLQSKLLSQQPPVKIPKAKIKKPKHKPGDIIIFKPIDMNKDEDDCSWLIQSFSSSKYFAKNNYRLPKKPLSPYDAHGKYLAILCVGKEQESYSKHFPNLFHEHSVYAFYDYCDEEKPTLAMLKQCGFLPTFDFSYSDFNKNILNSLYWTYTFVTIDPFHSKRSLVVDFERINLTDEHKRFYQLISKKNYLNNSIGCFTLQGAFESFFEEKIRFLSIGIMVDNLLNENTQNPDLLSPDAYNKLKSK